MTVQDKLLAIEKELNSIFEERAEPIRGIILASLSRSNLLFLGSAGIGKSALINQWNKRIEGAKYFRWLLTKFSTPEEIFGPPSLKALDEERYLRVTKNKLPEANTAFLDEIFKANSSILNTLLTVLNEREFYNDGVAIPLDDLITVAGASNEVPEKDDGLEAFFDRFLLKYWLKPIQENSSFIRMLRSPKLDEPPECTINIQDLKIGMREVSRISIHPTVYEHVLKLKDGLRKVGVVVTDRAYKTSMAILKAEAYLNKHSEVATADLEILKNVCWARPDQERTVHSEVLSLIAPEKNKIVTLFAECQDIAKSVYKHKDPGKKQNSLIEANKKIKDASVEIQRLKNDMKAKKQETADVDKMLNTLDQLLAQMASDVLGLSITVNSPDRS
jgi:MoxR-like ATPase